MIALAKKIKKRNVIPERDGAPVACPRIMPKKYRENRELMLKDFKAKASILNRIGEYVPHDDFYASMFQGKTFKMTRVKDSPDNEFLVVVKAGANKDEGEKHTNNYADTAAMTKDVAWRTDSYLFPMSFFAPLGRKKTVRDIYAYIVDLDEVHAGDLKKIIKKDVHGLRPTYGANSGGGVHLVYLLQRPTEYFKFRRIELDEIYKRLRDAQVDSNMHYKVDKACGLVHSFRVAGSLTKLGTIAAAYKVGELWTMDALADAVDVKIPDAPKQRPTKKEDTLEDGKVTSIPKFIPKWYQATYDYIIKHVKTGHRHNSMFALAIIAMKCRVLRERLREDLEKICEHFNAVSKGDSIDKGYPEYLAKYVKVTIAQSVRKETLENYLGMEDYLGHGYQKRNHRSRAEHLKAVHEKRRNETKKRIEQYLEMVPTASIKEIAEALCLDRHTVAKHKKEIQGLEPNGIERTSAEPPTKKKREEKSNQHKETVPKPRASTPPEQVEQLSLRCFQNGGYQSKMSSAGIMRLEAQILSVSSSKRKDELISMLPEGRRCACRQLWLRYHGTS